MLELKPISRDGIPQALVKAERYRLLNEPGQAESILPRYPRRRSADQEARVRYILALTDQFGPHEPDVIARAEEAAAELDDECAPSRVLRRHHLQTSRRGRAGQGGRGWGRTRAGGTRMRSTASTAPRRCVQPATTTRSCGGTACVRMLERHPDPSGDDDRDSRLLMLE